MTPSSHARTPGRRVHTMMACQCLTSHSLYIHSQQKNICIDRSKNNVLFRRIYPLNVKEEK